MNTFTVLTFCIQAFLFQNVYSQCTSRTAVDASGIAAPYGWPVPGLAAPFAPAGATLPLAASLGYRSGYADVAYPAAAWTAPYGGAGEGNVAVEGELPVAGSTGVIGQVPIMGAVNFSGALPAVGTVSITGQCSCGNTVPYLY